MHFSASILLVAGLFAGQSDKRPTKIWEKGTIAVHATKRTRSFRACPGERPVQLDDRYLMRAGVYWGRNYLPNPDFPGIERKPTCYHHAEGPVGLVLDRYDWFRLRPRNFGANDVRMPAALFGFGGGGTPSWAALVQTWSEPSLMESTMSSGTIAGYGRPYQTIRFFEEDERPFELCEPAKGEPLFTFIRDARRRGTNVETFLGPRRPTFEKQKVEDFYAAIFIEACPRDRLEDIAVEWMTREGMQSLMRSLRADGVIAYHTSNRYLQAVPALRETAESLDLKSMVLIDSGDFGAKAGDSSHFGSQWVLVAREDATLDRLKERARRKVAMKVDPSFSGPFEEQTEGRIVSYVWTDRGPNPIEGLFRVNPALMRKKETMGKDPAAMAFLLLTATIPEPEEFFLDQWYRSVPSAELLAREPELKVGPTEIDDWRRRLREEVEATESEPSRRTSRLRARNRRRSSESSVGSLQQASGRAYVPPQRGHVRHQLHPRAVRFRSQHAAGRDHLLPPARTGRSRPRRHELAERLGRGEEACLPLRSADARVAGCGGSSVAVRRHRGGTPDGGVVGTADCGPRHEYRDVRVLCSSAPGDRLLRERSGLRATVATNPKLFRYVSDAKARGAIVSVIPGESRISLEQRQIQGYYGAMFVELCQRSRLEDVEVGLMTREGMKRCMDALQENGILCYHISNRYLDLAPPLVDVATSLGYVVRVGDDLRESTIPPTEVDFGRVSSRWVAIARPRGKTSPLDSLGSRERVRLKGPPVWSTPSSDRKYVWTDRGPNRVGGLFRADPELRARCRRVPAACL